MIGGAGAVASTSKEAGHRAGRQCRCGDRIADPWRAALEGARVAVVTEPRRASPPAATGGVLGDRGVCGTTAAVCGNGCGRRRLAGPSLLVGCARGGPASAALQRYAQARTGLTAHEFAAMFDVIRNDAYDAEAPDAARFGSTLDGWSDRILRDAALRPVLRVWLLGLLREARERAAAGVVPDGPTWAAMRAVGETAARRAWLVSPKRSSRGHAPVTR